MGRFRQRELLPGLGEGKRLGFLENPAQLLQQAGRVHARECQTKGKRSDRWAKTQPQGLLCRAWEFELGQEVMENCCGVLSGAVAGSDSCGAFQQPALRLNRCEEYYSVGAVDEAGMRFCPAPLAEAQPLPKSHAHLPTPRAIGFPCGILLFILTKREVDQDRLKQMKARQNMRASNTGEYESQRFRASSRHAPSPEAGSGVQS